MLAYRAEVRAVTADTTPDAPEAADEAADEAELARATGAGAAPKRYEVSISLHRWVCSTY